MAGSVDLLGRCYLGIEMRDGVIWFDPLLPVEVRSLSLGIRYQRQWLTVSAEQGRFTVELGDWGAGTVLVGLDGDVAELGPGERRQMDL
jgi:alpha,alpha-trehalase